MKRTIFFNAYFNNIENVDLIIKGDKNLYSLIASDEKNYWYINLDIPHTEFEYIFLVNKKFYVNQLNCRYREYDGEILSVYSDEQVPSVQEYIQIKKCFTFSLINDNKAEKKVWFTPNDRFVHVFVYLENKYNTLLLIEWINPKGDSIYVSDYILKPNEPKDNFLILHKGNLFFGKWVINIYANGEKLGSYNFVLNNDSKYQKYNNLAPTAFERKL